MKRQRYKYLGETRAYDIYRNLLAVGRWFNRVGSHDCFLREFRYYVDNGVYEDFGVRATPRILDEVMEAIANYKRRMAQLN